MVVGARDRDLPGFKRLAQSIKYKSSEFSEFVEKQDAAMSQGNLVGARPRATISASNTPDTGSIPPRSDS